MSPFLWDIGTERAEELAAFLFPRRKVNDGILLGPGNCMTGNIKVTAVICLFNEGRDVGGQQPSRNKIHLCQVQWA